MLYTYYPHVDKLLITFLLRFYLHIKYIGCIGLSPARFTRLKDIKLLVWYRMPRITYHIQHIQYIHITPNNPIKEGIITNRYNVIGLTSFKCCKQKKIFRYFRRTNQNK